MREDLQLWIGPKVIGSLRTRTCKLRYLLWFDANAVLARETGFDVDAPCASVYGFRHHVTGALGLRVAEALCPAQ